MTFHLEKKQLLKGLGLALACFLLLVIGVGVLLDVSLKLQNLAVYFGYSVLAGSIYLILSGDRFRIVRFFFLIGLILGFIEMYRLFWQVLDGWGEIIGILSLLIWPILGLVLGGFIQFGMHVYKKYSKKKQQDRK